MSIRGLESQLDLCLYLLLVRHLWVVYERSAFGVWWLVASRRVLETFNDGLFKSSMANSRICDYIHSFAAAILAYDDGNRMEEFDDRD
jgi:hypothetical protein